MRQLKRNVMVIDGEELAISHYYWYENSVYHRISFKTGLIEYFVTETWIAVPKAA